MRSLDFLMRKMMDQKLSLLGTAISGESDRSIVILDDTDMPEVPVHLGSSNSLDAFDSGKAWVQAALVKIPKSLITRGDEKLTHTTGLYTIFIKTDKDWGEYINEDLSNKIEEHFEFNSKISLDGYLLTILKSHQQPSVSIDSKTGRYWNRVFVECEIYYKE